MTILLVITWRYHKCLYAKECIFFNDPKWKKKKEKIRNIFQLKEPGPQRNPKPYPLPSTQTSRILKITTTSQCCFLTSAHLLASTLLPICFKISLLCVYRNHHVTRLRYTVVTKQRMALLISSIMHDASRSFCLCAWLLQRSFLHH